MAFRRATGRDEMLKRNMEKLAARRRASASKPTATKQDLKVGTKVTANYMGGVGPYADGAVYAKALEGVKPPSQVQPPPQAYPDAPPPVRPDPPAETPPAQPDPPPAQPDPPAETPPEKPPKQPEIPKSLLEKLRSRDDGEGKIDLRNHSLLKNLYKFINEPQIKIGLARKSDGKKWAGAKYGFQSPASFKKLKAEGKI